MEKEEDITVILTRINTLGNEYGTLLRDNEIDDAEMNKKIDAIRAEYGAKTDPRTLRATEIKEELGEIITTHRPRLFTGRSKKLVLRTITINLRNADSIVVTDEDAAIRFLRLKRMMRMFVNRKVTLSINKTALGKRQDFARTIPGIEVHNKERATFTLPKVEIRPFVEISPQRVDLPERS